jgi:hypothetical protein
MALNININVNVSLGLSEEAKGWIMSAFDDELARLQVKVNSVLARLGGEIATLRSDLARQQANADSPERMKIVTDIEALVDAADPTNPATLPPGAGGG